MIADQIVLGLKNDDHDVFKTIYTSYRSDFFRFAKKYDISDEDVKDIFQDAIIALRNNAKNGKLDTLKSEVKTYLFSIGKFMIYQYLKQKKRMHPVNIKEDIYTIDVSYMDMGVFKEPLNPRQVLLRSAIEKLEPQCKKILSLFYYRGFTIDDITETFNYSSKNVTKSQKSRCMKKLKELTNRNPHD